MTPRPLDDHAGKTDTIPFAPPVVVKPDPAWRHGLVVLAINDHRRRKTQAGL